MSSEVGATILTGSQQLDIAQLVARRKQTKPQRIDSKDKETSISTLTESARKIVNNLTNQRGLVALSNLTQKTEKFVVNGENSKKTENMRSSPISIEEQFQNQLKQSIEGHILNNTKRFLNSTSNGSSPPLQLHNNGVSTSETTNFLLASAGAMDLSSTTSPCINNSKFPVYGKDIENASTILNSEAQEEEEEEEEEDSEEGEVFKEDDLVDDEEAVKESQQNINSDAVQKAQILFGSPFMQQNFLDLCNLEMRQHFQHLFEEQQKKAENEENILVKRNSSMSPRHTNNNNNNNTLNSNEFEEDTVASTSYCKFENDCNSKSCDNCQEKFDTKFKHICPPVGNNSLENKNLTCSTEQLLMQCNTCSLNFHSLLELRDHNCLKLQKKNCLEEERFSAPPQVCPTNLQLKRNSECRSVPTTLTLPPFHLILNKHNNRESSNLTEDYEAQPIDLMFSHQKNLLIKKFSQQMDNPTNNMGQLFNGNLGGFSTTTIPPMILAQLYATANEDEESVKKFLQQIGFGHQMALSEEAIPNGLDLTGAQVSSRKRRRSGDSDCASNSEVSPPSKASTTGFNNNNNSSTTTMAQLMQSRHLPPHLALSFGNSMNESHQSNTLTSPNQMFMSQQQMAAAAAETFFHNNSTKNPTSFDMAAHFAQSFSTSFPGAGPPPPHLLGAMMAAAAAAAGTGGANGNGSSNGGCSEDDWESMMEVSNTDEAGKIRALAGDNALPVTDPNQCMLCRRVLSCKSALQMHYRTHTGERPFKCKLCQRAFTTKGNLKTHMGVHKTKHMFRSGTCSMGSFGGGGSGSVGPLTGGSTSMVNNTPSAGTIQQCPICHTRLLVGQLQQHMLTQHTNHLTRNAGMPTTTSPNFETSQLLLANPQLSSNSNLSSVATTSSFNSLTTTTVPSTNNNNSCFSTINLLMKDVPNDGATTNSDNNSGTSCSGDSSASIKAEFPSAIPESKGFSGATIPKDFLSAIQMGLFPAHLIPSGFFGLPGIFGANSGILDSPKIESPINKTGGGNVENEATNSCKDIRLLPTTTTSDEISSNNDYSKEKKNLLDDSKASKIKLEKLQNSFKKDSSNSENNSEPKLKKEFLENFLSLSSNSVPKLQSQLNNNNNNNDTINSTPNPLDAIQKMYAETELESPPRPIPPLSKHQCRVCRKHFSSSSALQIHMRTHTGERPFKCEACSRTFTTRGNLKVHMTTHDSQQNPSRRGRKIFDYPPNGALMNDSMGEQNAAAAAARAALAAAVANGALSNGGGLPFGLSDMSMLGLMNAATAGMDMTNARLQMDALWMFQNTCPICQTVLSNNAELQQHFETHIAAIANASANNNSSSDLNGPEDNSVQDDEEENPDEECEENEQINGRKNSEALEKKQSAVNVN